MTDVENKIKSMGLVIKPKKCRSLSIEKGETRNIQFTLRNDTKIDSIIDKPMKFLGSELTEAKNPLAMFTQIFSKLEVKLQNIDKSTLRGEFKTNLYSRYALPSMGYYLAVHQLHKTHREKLDTLARKYLKKWLQIPSHGATDASIFHPFMLNFKTPSQLYEEVHGGNHVAMRTKGDQNVNHALDSRIERESQWTNKSFTVCSMEKMWQEIQEENLTQGAQTTKPSNIMATKKLSQKSLKDSNLNTWNDKVKKLVLQGDFINI